MADLRDADRGQLLMITALAIGVASLVLILLFNGAIYTQNVSSRALASDDRQALMEAETFIEGAERLLKAENDRDHQSSEAVYNNLSEGIRTMGTLQRRHELKGGVYTGPTGLTLSNGSRLKQDTPGTFNSSGDNPDWKLAEGADKSRNATITVDSVENTPDPINESFVFEIDGSSNDWKLYVFRESGSGELNISTSTGGPPLDEACPGADVETPVTISLTNASINGSACSDIAYWKDVSQPDEISISHGENATGTYEITVNTTSIYGFNSPGGPDPYWEPVIYSVNGTFQYRSPSLRYTKGFRHAPGEPDE